MGGTFEGLLNDFIKARDAEYHGDHLAREAARIDNLERTMQAMLEKLRDRLDP